MVVFLNFNFLFFILFFPYYYFFYPYNFLFFPIFFSSTHVPLLFSFLFFLFFPYHFLQTLEHSTKLSFFLFLFYLFSFFLSLFSLISSSTSFFPFIPSKHTNLKITHNHTIWFSSNEVGSIKYTEECALKKTKKEEEDGVRVSFRAKGRAKRWDEMNEESGREN